MLSINSRRGAYALRLFNSITRMNYKRETLQKRFERLEESRRTENERLTRESNNIGRAALSALMRDDTPSDTSEKETI